MTGHINLEDVKWPNITVYNITLAGEPTPMIKLHDLKYMPKADVVERKRGKWIARPAYKGAGWGVFVCSVCDNPVWWATDFCHNCGADMREVDK